MHEITFRVDYSDTDAMGVVHHSNYFRWWERARTAWFRSIGKPYSVLEKEGYFFPLRKAEIEYFKPIYYDEEVRVRVWASEVGRVNVIVSAQVLKEDILLCHGKTHHVLVRRITDEKGVQSFKPTQIPQEWRSQWLQPTEAKF